MGKPNYSFAKHQRDLAKKKKREEKLRKKMDARQQSSKPDEEETASTGEGSAEVSEKSSDEPRGPLKD